MKAGGANRIRYPGSPSRKRCKLDDPIAVRDRSVAGKPLSLPPGEYGRKAESTSREIISTSSSSLKGIGGGAPQGVKPAVQLESTPGNLPGATAG